MDLKKEAAGAAIQLIRNGSSVGLGAGATINWMADFLKKEISNGLNLNLYTSSEETRKIFRESGIPVSDISGTDRLDQYFDGCDQIDHQLNALKSGAGIHTMEKLLASMAGKFIILADESKWVSRMDARFPLVLELLPESVCFIQSRIKKIFPESRSLLRTKNQQEDPVITMNGNLLLDIWFHQWPELDFVQENCKNITGVVEISLFYAMAHQAIISGHQGIKIIHR